MSKDTLLDIDDECDCITLANLDAIGWKTVQGWSSKYDNRYPASLHGIIPEKEFQLCIDAINQTAEDYFPCPPGYVGSYILCFSTLGLSLLCCKDPWITDMRNGIEKVLEHINRRKAFRSNGIVWSLNCPASRWHSWVSISQLN